MTRIQEKVIELLAEIDAIARSNGIKYSLFGRTAVMAAKSGTFYNRDYFVEIAMTADNYRRFLEVCGRGLADGRELENASTNPRMDGIYSRYVNSETTLIDNRRGFHYRARGIYVNIVPLVSSVPGSRIYRIRERCVLANSWKAKEPRSRLEAARMRVERVFFSDAKKYYDLCMRACDRPSKTLSCRNIMGRKMRFSRAITEDYTDICFEGLTLMSFRDVDAWVDALCESGCYRKAEEKAWRAGVLGVVGNAYVPYRMLVKEATRAGVYGAGPDRDYRRLQEYHDKVYKPLADREAADWRYVTRTKDRFALWEKYGNRSDELKAAYERGETGYVRGELAEYIEAIREYAACDMGFSIDTELYEICLKLLEDEGEAELAKKARGLVPAEYRRSVGEYLKDEGYVR